MSSGELELDLASIDHVLRTTRSVRRRLDFDRPVDPALIEECIEIATQAPTGAQAENWRFVVVVEPDVKFKLAELYRSAFDRFVGARPGGPPAPRYRALADRLHEFPVLILACIEGRAVEGTTAQQVALYGSILPAAWSLMIALRARGLGTTWTTLLTTHEREVAEILAIPESVTQTVLLPVGHMRQARLRPAERKPPAEITFWDRWGRRRES